MSPGRSNTKIAGLGLTSSAPRPIGRRKRGGFWAARQCNEMFNLRHHDCRPRLDPNLLRSSGLALSLFLIVVDDRRRRGV